ncbi:MAG TPA: phosphate ABC transporter permease PstA [Vicinamibacteria bacterium]|nr:phosphate ABC transporter permease PstA [Vicinamibacteria bacterium]
MSLAKSIRRGDPLIWFTGSALGACILMIAGLILVILVNGLGFFWPQELVRITLKDGSAHLGEVSSREAIPNPGQPDHLQRHRLLLRVGNRDLYGIDFKWFNEDDIVTLERPAGAFFVERSEYGPLLGEPTLVKQRDEVIAEGAAAATALPGLIARADADRAAIKRIEKGEIGEINYRIEQARLAGRRLDLELPEEPGKDVSARRGEIEREAAQGKAAFEQKTTELQALLEKVAGTYVTFRTVDGKEKELRALDIYRAYAANQLSWPGRLAVYTSRLWTFFADDPRESNTEGGIFPAIFGTVMMVLIMSIIVVPTGVLAALYLREYARQGALVRMVRIAVNNLAGVPSIVFGVFGLGFFVYFVGGGIDKLFFPEALPTPTYGTGGILWAALTLALLTVPVVIVASEEALAAVPRSMREASLAMGATKFQTIVRVVLPAAAPGILTGLILAMARGAGEVAPLMLTGVVKLAPELPMDGVFPFFHLDRKFMHLGFHIYDVGFQSPNVEAAKPMVYTTTIFLLLIVVLLNLTAIVVRNRLREKYKTGAF